MPRTARLKSATGIYHIVIRGADKHIIFEENKDYLKYLELLELYKEECGFQIYAYCLMSNHIHLILKETFTQIETIFRKLNTHYAVWFNLKYNRTGHLQQDRYYSEPIDNQFYFLTAIRYVHRNPLNAGLELSPGEQYPWSSIHEYLNNHFQLIDSDYVFSIISPNIFLDYNNTENNDECLDVTKRKRRIPDDVAKDILLTLSNCSTTTEFTNLNLVLKKRFVKNAHKEGVSIRQLNRLTGISLGSIQRILKKSDTGDTPRYT